MRSGLIETLMGLIELSRPINSLMGVLGIFVGIAMASGEFPLSFMPVDQVLLHVVGGFFISASIMTLNDVIDHEIDKINAPWRPIPSGRVSLELAWAVGLATALIGIALSLLIDPVPQVTALALIALVLAHSYNFYLKRTPLLGNVVVAWVTALPIAYGGLAVSHYLGPDSVNWTRLALIWFMAFTAVLGREVVKSVADIEGDRAKEVKTIAVLLGPEKALYLASLFYLIAVASSLAIAFVGDVNLAVYLPPIIVIDLLALRDLARLLRKPEPVTALAHKNRVLYLMLLALIVIYMAST
ncbi:MAG: geranylgeranylglycerol-phosphate geranylgeranyltransferase [Acidilobaceae archaeon]